MKVFIIEDEKLGAERLRLQLEELDASIEILGVVDTIKAAVLWLQAQEQPDLIFMDIELADGQSFEIFKQVDVKSAVIFTTSYDEYTLQAFKVNSIDYLLKPIKTEELRQSLEKYQQLQQQYLHRHALNINNLIQELKQQTQTFRSRFLVKHGQRLVSIDTSEIAYFFVDGRLTFFKTWDNTKFIVEYSLEDLERMLNPSDYYRINRSFLVHIQAIENAHNYFNGKLKLELRPAIDKDVTVSRENATPFKEWLGK